MGSPIPTIALVGATATGKSALAMALAERLQGEIVNCDSLQVVRGFDIGTAKASIEEQRKIPHHLLDVTEAHAPLDASVFADMARKIITDIQARGRVAIVCGGTGLYFRALRWGLIDAPAADPNLREHLEKQEKAGPGFLMRRLHALDPEGAATIDHHNLVRVLRAVELCELTGKPASSLRHEHGFSHEKIPMHALWLRRPRDVLHAAIAQRTKHMLESGLIDEVRGLLANGVDPACRAMQSVGYREVLQFLAGEISKDDLEHTITVRTRRYARRQETWFRAEKMMRSIEVTNETIPMLADRAQVELSHA